LNRVRAHTVHDTGRAFETYGVREKTDQRSSERRSEERARLRRRAERRIGVKVKGAMRKEK